MVVLVIAVLILINALYVAAEFSAVSVRASRVQQRAEDGSKLAARLLPILTDARKLDDYIAACQVGITLSSLIVGAYAQATLAPALTPLFGRLGSLQEEAALSVATTVVLVGLTVIQMIFGELVPKSVALQAPTQMALATVAPMQVSLRVLRWFIRVLNGSGAVVLRMMRVREAGHRHIHSAQEIEYLITESGQGGLLKPSEQLRLRHALQLARRPARQLMIPRTRMEALDVDTPFVEALRVATDSPYTRFPVYEESIDNVVGVVHARDLALAWTDDSVAPSMRELMRPALVLPDSMPADRLLTRLKEERHTMAILADEFGGTAGLITVDNILDELIGDIADEFQPDTPKPERLPDGRVRLPGTLRVEDAAQWARIRWDTRAVTVAGMVVTAFGHVPAEGERITLDGIDIEVERVTRRVVESVIITPPPPRRPHPATRGDG